MENLSKQLNKATAILILVIIVLILLSGGMYYWFTVTKQGTNDQSAIINQPVDKENNTVIDTTNWVLLPVYNDYVDFLISYPSDWEIMSDVSESPISEGQPLVWFGNNTKEFDIGIMSFGVSYFHDAGDTLVEWVAKRDELLAEERGVQAESTEFQQNGFSFIQNCYKPNSGQTPFTSCHAYFHDSPYIFELKTEILSATEYEIIKAYESAFLSVFRPLMELTEDWGTFNATNAGFQIRYPVIEYPPADSDSSFQVGFGNDFYKSYIQVRSIVGYPGGALDYWHDMTYGIAQESSTIPRNISIGGEKCYFADLTSSDYVDVANNVVTYCLIGNRLFEVSIFPGGTEEIDDTLLVMLGSLTFSSREELSKEQYTYRNNEVGFSLQYPSYISITEQAVTGEARYIGFERNTFDGLWWKKFGITYEKTALTLQECFDSETCFLYGDFLEYSDSLFAGEQFYLLEYDNDYGDDVIAQDKTFVVKRGGYIIQIQTVTDSAGDNRGIDLIINSFKFL